jgi:hypothetical protein
MFNKGIYKSITFKPEYWYILSKGTN